MLELATDDSLRAESESVAIERDRALEVIHAEGEDSEAWLHGVP
jgi:hypothetical protein